MQKIKHHFFLFTHIKKLYINLKIELKKDTGKTVACAHDRRPSQHPPLLPIAQTERIVSAYAAMINETRSTYAIKESARIITIDAPAKNH